MARVETLTPRARLLLVAGLLVTLAGLFVLAGTIEPDPRDNSYPNTDEIAENPNSLLGERVVVGGTVTAHDPVQIRFTGGVDRELTVTVTNVDDPPPVGHELQAFGTLTDPTTVEAETALARAPWETWYMYVVSFVGGLWVLGRLVAHWRPDSAALSVVPRRDRDG